VDTVYFYTDETGTHTKGRYFLVAGIAITRHQKWIEDQLHHAERVSGKGKQDWKGEKNVNRRVRYLQEVFAIQNLRGTVFYCAFPDNAQDYWGYTVEAITMALARFGVDRRNYIRHQGFGFKTRQKLTAALAAGNYDFEIQTGSEKRAEIRLADAICGFLGLSLFNAGCSTADFYPAIPDWFINLKNEAPVMKAEDLHRGQASR
jgi:hypothetical protein